ncbi:hypothetical protein VNI00_009861 [Paramarasmius palmivorus]|uniref:Uncharacterized protein n=1 Tax=Paramarasmius palmivorus TaxID=297713 RepID=A0AAW0CKX2_9AGAR
MHALGKSRPSPIRVMDCKTFKRLFHDTPSHHYTNPQTSPLSPEYIAIPHLPCTSKPLHTPTTKDRPDTSISAGIEDVPDNDDCGDIIDLYGSVPADDDDDDWDITPPVTPRWHGLYDHVKVADSNVSGDEHHFHQYPGRHRIPSSPLQHLTFGVQPENRAPKSQMSIPRASSITRYNWWDEIDSPTQPHLEDDLSGDCTSRSSKTEETVDRIARPVALADLDPPEFTNPFAMDTPLEPLPRLRISDYKPLSSNFLRNSAETMQEDFEEGEVFSATLLCIPRRPVVEKPVLMKVPPKSGRRRKRDLSPHDRRGMSANERRMFRLMCELFPDIAHASVDVPTGPSRAVHSSGWYGRRGSEPMYWTRMADIEKLE